jgi:hypothetical protein
MVGKQYVKKTSIVLLITALGADLLMAAEPSPRKVLKFAVNDSLDQIERKIMHNGYDFTVGHTWVFDMPTGMREEMRGRYPSPFVRLEDGEDDIGPLAGKLGNEALPASFDWRSREGHSYIGPVKNQGVCGSCYAFAACAVAESAYNKVEKRYDGNCVDLSEAFLMWCLGRLPEYSPHFYGCWGADYEYMELQALVSRGVCFEVNFPYTVNDPRGCYHWEDSRIRFASWHRVPCGELDAIKAAIMNYGLVTAAVCTSSAFDAYQTGVYEDANTACTESPCYYAPTDHSVALVGWNDNGDPGSQGYWILRNSWGADWGEGGYMRIKYRSAYVACQAAYLTYDGSSPIPKPEPVITPTPFPDGIQLYLNQEGFKGGDTLMLNLTFKEAPVDWDAYLVLTGRGHVWSLMGHKLKKGIHSIVTNAREKHEPFVGTVFTKTIPLSAAGEYKIYAVILPTGYAPSLRNAGSQWGQLATLSFSVTP